MTTATLAVQPSAHPFRRHRWSSAEFHRLIDAGFIREGSRTFLWDGEIVEPMPENPPHIHVVENLRDLLSDRYPRDAWAISQDKPLALRDGFEPAPDLLVLRGPRIKYVGRFANPGDVVLLIEVSSTSYTYDSGSYLEAYARAGIPVYWIVNLLARRIEVYAGPDPERGVYGTRQDFPAGSSVPVEGAPIAVDEVLRFAAR